jgi:hypothetical protein
MPRSHRPSRCPLNNTETGSSNAPKGSQVSMKASETTGPEERLAELFQPDTLMPSQYFDRLRRRTEYEGERRLLIAVLEDAVDVYRKQVAARDVRAQEMFREAEEWIENPDQTWLFSFANICDVLDLDAEYLRRGLRAWKRRALSNERRVVPLHIGQEDRELRKASGD